MFLERRRIATLDITGGAPELNAHFRRIVTAARAMGVQRDGPLQPHDLRGGRATGPAGVSRRERVEIVASLPCYLAGQRRPPARQGRVRRLDPRPAPPQRAGLRARWLGSHAQSRLQSARAFAAAAAGCAGGRLQANPWRPARRHVQQPLHARQHADPALRLDARIQGRVRPLSRHCSSTRISTPTSTA